LSEKKLKISVKLIWLFLFIIASYQSAIGFLAISGWQQGVIDAILSIKN
jgi:hypothetical protein